MTKLLRNLWNDDDGAVITTEFMMLVAVLFFGLIPALIGFRNLIGASLLNAGNLIYQVTSNTSFDGYQIQGSTPGANTPIASTPGYNPSTGSFPLVMDSTGQNAPNNATFIDGTTTTVTPDP